MRRALEKCADPVEAGEAALIGEAEPFGRRLGLRVQIGIVELRQMDHSAVIAEVIVAQLRKPVEAEAANDERVEMAGEKIGEVERARLFLGEGREGLLSGIERVAMRALDAASPPLPASTRSSSPPVPQSP